MQSSTPRLIYEAIQGGDVASVRRLLTSHPDVDNIFCWLHDAAASGHIRIVELLLSMGYDINHTVHPEESTPVSRAVHNGHVDMVRYLLDHEANPNIGRLLIGAINEEPGTVGLELVKLLVEHGADVNRVFPWFGDETVAFSPLGWAEANGKTAIADYLRSKGAVLAEKKEYGKSPKTT